MATKETKRARVPLGWVVAALLVAAVVLAVRFYTREKVGVRTAQVTHQTLVSSVSTNGKVEPIEEWQAHAPGPSVIRKIYVEVGDHVRAGQLMIGLNDSDAQARLASASSSLQTAEANAQDIAHGGTQDERIALGGELERAKAQESQASKDIAALNKLESHGAASAAEVAAAQQRLQVAQITLRGVEQRSTGRYGASDTGRSKAQIADARAALAAAQSTYASENIRTPIAGTVYAVPVSNYDFVPAGDELLDVADLNRIRIRAYFDEPEIGKLQPGQEVKVVWDAKPGMTWHGHVEQAPTTIITYGTRNVGECIITVNDAHGDLPPNSNVTVTVTTSQRVNALSVPREALHTDAGNYVYRIVGSRLQRTPIEVGLVNLTRVEVVSGLAEKDLVVLNTTTNRDLTSGLEVKTVEE